MSSPLARTAAARTSLRRPDGRGPDGRHPDGRRAGFAGIAGALLIAAAPFLAIGLAPAAFADAPSARVAAATPLVEADVRKLMQQVEAAARARDVPRLAALLADDCTIELRTRMGGREHVTTFTKAEYVEMLTSGYAAMRDLQAYDYTIGQMQVELEPAGATVRAVVHEAAVFPGGTVATRSEEVSRVERRGDALLLVGVTATTEAAPAQVKVR
jgi:ketosteroid isomerase-like protein